jgi:hypothetical protein
MRTNLPCLLTLASAVAGCTTSADDLAVDWHSIDAGGGVSIGGAYILSGTIGQLDAGPTSIGGEFTITGGFWTSPAAGPAPEPPKLMVAMPESNLAQISWSPPTPGFVLQTTTSLSPPEWENTLTGATNPVTLLPTLRVQYFRLIRP